MFLSIIYKKNSIAIDPIYPPPDLNKWSNAKKDLIPENLEINNKF